MKFALVSSMLPPGWDGQAMVINRLLQDLSPGDYCLISRHYDVGTARGGNSPRLACNYYHLPPDEIITRGNRFGLDRLRKSVNALPSIALRGRRIAGIIKSEQCEAVIACTGDVIDMPAAYLASRLTGASFYPYIFDHYSYREWVDPVARLLARCLESHLLKKATGVIVPNETLRDELRARHEVDSVLIHNSCDMSEYSAAPPETPVGNTGAAKITYTGAIYEAHFDAFHNLLAAIKLIGRPDVELHIYTAQQRASLEGNGIRGSSVVYHEPQEAAAMPKIQRDSDLLFLPLAFDSPYPDLIRTSATTKMGEYLASHRPVLVHAPRDTFIAWYVRQHQCGLVVDEPDPVKLAQAVTLIFSDPALRKKLTERAWDRARADFSISTAQSKFAQLMGLKYPKRSEAPKGDFMHSNESFGKGDLEMVG